MLRHFLQVDDIAGRFLSPREPPYSLTDGAFARTRQLYAIRDCARLDIRVIESNQHVQSRLIAQHLGPAAIRAAIVRERSTPAQIGISLCD